MPSHRFLRPTSRTVSALFLIAALAGSAQVARADQGGRAPEWKVGATALPAVAKSPSVRANASLLDAVARFAGRQSPADLEFMNGPAVRAVSRNGGLRNGRSWLPSQASR